MDVSMDRDEQELLKDFRGLSPANKSYVLSLSHAVKASQETAMNAMESARRDSIEEKAHGKPAA